MRLYGRHALPNIVVGQHWVEPVGQDLALGELLDLWKVAPICGLGADRGPDHRGYRPMVRSDFFDRLFHSLLDGHGSSFAAAYSSHPLQTTVASLRTPQGLRADCCSL